MTERKKPARRLFVGMAGSPLARLNEAIPLSEVQPTSTVPAPAPARRGRPRKHSSNKEKQSAYRQREAWQKAFEDNKDDRGRLHGETSGGNAGPRLEYFYGASAFDPDAVGGCNKPEGHGPDEELGSNSRGSGEGFRRVRVPWNKVLSEQEKEWLADRVTAELFQIETKEGTRHITGVVQCSCGFETDCWTDAVEHVNDSHADLIRARWKKESASGVAAIVTSTSAPFLRVTVLPASSCNLFSIRISWYKCSAPSTRICAFSGSAGAIGGIIFSTVPGRVTAILSVMTHSLWPHRLVTVALSTLQEIQRMVTRPNPLL
jgi:hypothetical protein